MSADERIHKALTAAFVDEWKNDKSTKVVHVGRAPVRETADIESANAYGDFYKAHAERLAEALKEVRDRLPYADKNPAGRIIDEAIAAWEGQK